MDELTAKARAAQGYARAEYSGFRVGAAIESSDGRIFNGCNVESSSYGLSICAERCALVKALSEGADGFTRIVIVTDAAKPAPPCGACRQLLWDYAPNINIITIAGERRAEFSLKDIYPHPFGRDNLQDIKD
ncbi:cytidine deaminase [bacterium]|nr:cytidine deaminase [bacterium]